MRAEPSIPTQEYYVQARGRRLSVLGPVNPHAMHQMEEHRGRPDDPDFRPWWAEPWHAAGLLADYIISSREPPRGPVLEIGAGLGITSVILALHGFRMIATDYEDGALEFCRINARRNGADLHDVRRLDWRHPPTERYELIVGSELAYERRNLEPIAALLRRCLSPTGQACVGDLNRGAADAFPEVARNTGLHCRTVPLEGPPIVRNDGQDGRRLRGRVFVLRQPDRTGD